MRRLPGVNVDGLRAAFPVCASRAYLNAGTDGPIASQAVAAARAELDDELASGRVREHFERRMELRKELRDRYAARLGTKSEDVAITSSTSEVQPVDGAGDVILTSTDEHPGLLGPLASARDRHGVELELAAWDDLPDAVRAETALVACSHINWVDGRVVPERLATRCAEGGVPLLLDRADVEALGCSVYSGSGQKWLCGPDGAGMLWVAPAMRDAVAVTDPGWSAMADPHDPLSGKLQPDGRRYDGPSLSREATAFAIAAHDVLAEVGFDAVHERARALAATFAQALVDSGRDVMPRGQTTLVSWRFDGDSEAERNRLHGEGVVIRDLPGRGILRASVGAWNDESDLQRLLEVLA